MESGVPSWISIATLMQILKIAFKYIERRMINLILLKMFIILKQRKIKSTRYSQKHLHFTWFPLNDSRIPLHFMHHYDCL